MEPVCLCLVQNDVAYVIIAIALVVGGLGSLLGAYLKGAQFDRLKSSKYEDEGEGVLERRRNGCAGAFGGFALGLGVTGVMTVLMWGIYQAFNRPV